jgi:hypothetical protein
MFSIEDWTGFLIKGDLKGLNTMVVRWFGKIVLGQREVLRDAWSRATLLDRSDCKGLV